MQIRSGQAMVTVGAPNRITFSGMAPSDAGLLAPGQLFKFAGETTTGLFTVASVVSVTPTVVIELIDDYSGSIEAGVLSSYLIARDFTPLHGLPELSPGDADIRDIYTHAMRIIDTTLLRAIIASGLASVTTSATSHTVTGAFPTPPYGVLATPSWLTTLRVRADTSKTTTQFVLDFGTAAPAGAAVTWAVLTA